MTSQTHYQHLGLLTSITSPPKPQKISSHHAAFFLRLSINILLSKVSGRANHKILSIGHPVWLLEPLPVLCTSWDWSVWWQQLIWHHVVPQATEGKDKRNPQPKPPWATDTTTSKLTDADTVSLLLSPPLSPETWVNSTPAPHSIQAKVAQREIQAPVPENRDNRVFPLSAISSTRFPVYPLVTPWCVSSPSS